MKELPTRVDVMPTAKCNLDCPFCWGPSHSIKDGLNADQWFVLMAGLHNEGMEEIVFSGGEPLVRQDITTLMMVSHLMGYKVTLSTNCLLLAENVKKSPNVLDYTHEIGIPIDGSSMERNKILRIGNTKQFDAAISALSMIRSDYPQIHTTVRTVVTQTNIDDIINIGKVIAPISPDRWKIYEFTPIEAGLTSQGILSTTTEAFTSVVNQAAETFPELKIEPQYKSVQQEKYIFVGPRGDMYSMDENLTKIHFGNPLEIGNEVLDRAREHFSEL